MSKPKIHDRTRKIYPGGYYFRQHRDRDNTPISYQGAVPTEYGYVNVECVHRGKGCTFLDFIHGGIIHTRTINRAYQPKYLVTLAKRFAAEITQEIRK